MKKSVLFFALIVTMFSSGAYAQKQGTLTINTKYVGIVEGYDHMNKTDIYLDGNLVGSTTSQLQSKPNSFKVSADQGKHAIRIVNMAYYQGNWEEHTIANEYSLDALYEGEIDLKKKLTVNLVFDIEKEETFTTFK